MTDWVTWSKVLPLLVYPFNLALWFLVFGLFALFLKWHRAAVVGLTFALVVLGVSSSPLSAVLYHHHETTYLPIPIAESPTAGAIVLLSGDVGLPMPPRIESQMNGNRVLHAFRLYQAGKAPLILVSGGNVFPQSGVKAEAFYSADILESWGVPTDAIIVETNSRNTYENARQTKKILQTREIDTILLVTSAFHMPRALATFRHAGPRVLPSPSGYSLASYRKPVLLEWWPTLGNLARAQALVHENLGILIYRLRGWTI